MVYCTLSLLIFVFQICMKIHLCRTIFLDVKPNIVCLTLKWNGSHFIEYKFDFLCWKIEYFWKWRRSLRHSLLYLTFLIKFSKCGGCCRCQRASTFPTPRRSNQLKMATHQNRAEYWQKIQNFECWIHLKYIKFYENYRKKRAQLHGCSSFFYFKCMFAFVCRCRWLY